MARKLGYAVVAAGPKDACGLLQAFMRPFPSLDGIDPQDVLRSCVVSDKEIYADPQRAGVRQNAARGRILEALDAASCDGEWPGEAEFEDWRVLAGEDFSFSCRLIPYVGDRTITVHGTRIGQGHLTNTVVSVEIDCIARPSAQAMQFVIDWLGSYPDQVVNSLWAEGEPNFGHTQWPEVSGWEEIFGGAVAVS